MLFLLYFWSNKCSISISLLSKSATNTQAFIKSDIVTDLLKCFCQPWDTERDHVCLSPSDDHTSRFLWDIDILSVNRSDITDIFCHFLISSVLMCVISDQPVLCKISSPCKNPFRIQVLAVYNAAHILTGPLAQGCR